MQAKDLMVAGPNVVSITPDDSIYTAIRLMLQIGISGLPVVDIGALGTRRLVGVVTEGDLLRRRETGTMRRRPRWLEFVIGPGKLADEYVHATSRKIADVMTAPAVTVIEDTSVDDIVRLMERHQIKRLPVVRGEMLVGIITRANLLRALVREASRTTVVPVNDAAIKDSVVAELKRQPWGGASLIDVSVTDGSVLLKGTIMDERERKAVVVAARSVPGVRAIEDRMVLVDLVPGIAI